MSGSSSPVNSGSEAANEEQLMRLKVRKDLFPEVCLPKLGPDISESALRDEEISCVKLETDFEKSIDDIANQKLVMNGTLSSGAQLRHRKSKQRSRKDSEQSVVNGYLPSKSKRKKKGHHDSKHRNIMQLHVKGGKNLNLVSSTECQEDKDNTEEELAQEDSESSEDEVLPQRVKLPLINMPRQSGKPYSHELSQLSTKRSKSKNSSKERKSHAVTPCSGKPRAMLSIGSSRKSKKKSKKSDCKATYRSQIIDTNTIKIKIRRTRKLHEEVITPTPTSVADIGQRKSKKKRAASPVASISSGEEYDPSRGDTAAAMSVAASKPRHPPPPKNRKSNRKTKCKNKKTEKSKISGSVVKDMGPQSPWAETIPEEILFKIFDEVVTLHGSLPSVIRLSRVCKLWHSVSCRPELWRNIDLAQYTSEKCKTDYKLVWLLENRLSHCQSLNVGQWKVSNITWVLACIMEYCPGLMELGVAGWSRLTPEQLFDLVQGLPKLQRLDLSLTSEMGGSSTCLSAASVARVMENFGERFTHLTLANNKFTALPQILSSIATYCPNLEVLDISGATATSHPAAVPLEALQKGCPKLRVFRAANAQLVLANQSMSQKGWSGWTLLEELSIAGGPSSERSSVGEYRLNDEALARLVRDACRLRLLDLRALQQLSDSGLVRVPAWDLQHLFLGGCNVTRQKNSCLELICQKWRHSLIELDLSWASAAKVLDDAVAALADTPNSKLRILNLCGSSVSLEPIKKVLGKCPHVESLNLSSCRALPRGMKRHYTGKELEDLKNNLNPQRGKTKDSAVDASKKRKDSVKDEQSDKSESSTSSPKDDIAEVQVTPKLIDKSSSPVFQEPNSIPENKMSSLDRQTNSGTTKISHKTQEVRSSTPENRNLSRGNTPKLLSPSEQKPDSSSTPRSDQNKTELGNFYFSPVSKPDSQAHNSPDVQTESIKTSNSWSLGQFKTTPTHKPDASPLNRLESHNKLKHNKIVEQCSPTTSLENKPSPENIILKQDIKNPNNYYGNYSPMPRQDSQFTSQKSPYSAQPSPAQPSPYSTQPSPYSTQPSPYSSQPSPYSAQPSPDTSQIVKQDLQKSGAWNTGNYSPMPKHHSPFSPHPSTHTSPDPGLSTKGDSLRNNPNKTPGQYSPMSRQDRLVNSPYSPRSNVDITAYSNKKSPGVGNYSPLMRQDYQLTSPDGSQNTRPIIPGRLDMFGRPVTKLPEMHQNLQSDIAGSWGMERFNPLAGTAGVAGVTGQAEGAAWRGEMPPAWSSMSYDNSARRPNEDISDTWTLGQFRVEPPHQVHNTFTEQNVTFDSLSSHLGLPSQLPQGYLDDSYTETSRVD